MSTTPQQAAPPTQAQERSGLLAHPQDIHCVVFHLVTLAMYAAAFTIHLRAPAFGLHSWSELLAFDLGAALMLGWCSGIEVGVNFHNHAHRRIFTVPAWNRWFGRTWTVSSGWPAYFWQYSHVVVHHRHLLEDEDWTLPKQREDGSFENFFRYCLLHWPWRYVPHMWRELRQPVASRAVASRARKEFWIFVALFSIPFWIDVRMALLLWVLPAYLANALVVGPGMIAQHAGREAPSADHTYRHSNTFRSRLFNLTMFNIGYHAEHHTYPHVHWSELPTKHAQIREDLVADGAHVVPFGYYRGGLLLSRAQLGNQVCAEEWERQDPRYLKNPLTQASAPRAQPEPVLDALPATE